MTDTAIKTRASRPTRERVRSVLIGALHRALAVRGEMFGFGLAAVRRVREKDVRWRFHAAYAKGDLPEKVKSATSVVYQRALYAACTKGG